MIAPWKFQCENLHIQFEAKLCHEGLPPKISEALDCLPREAIVTQSMLLTLSRMHSTCYSDSDFITSHEAILKVRIELNAEQYYFPILAIVDAPHSITRGALLGYNKQIGHIQFGATFSRFDLEGVDNSIQFNTSSAIENIPYLPHITYRNYRTPDFEIRGLSKLDIADYISTPTQKCTSLKIDFPFLEKCGITPITPYTVGMISDSFTVKGAHYV